MTQTRVSLCLCEKCIHWHNWTRHCLLTEIYINQNSQCAQFKASSKEPVETVVYAGVQ